MTGSSPALSTGGPRLVIAAPGSGPRQDDCRHGADGRVSVRRSGGGRLQGRPRLHRPGLPRAGYRSPGRNLDPYLCGEHQLVPLLLHGALEPEPADVAVIEGVMGLFDGQIGGEGFASTAHVATLIQTPVILVLDISHTSRTAAAIVHGLNTFDPNVR